MSKTIPWQKYNLKMELNGREVEAIITYWAKDYYIDITPYFKKKLSSILQHKSQDPQKFAYATKLLNRFRSAQCNAPDGHYAEAFRADKRFPYTEIRSLLPPAPPLRKFYKSLSDSMI